ncbi:MAG: hypothetical protein HQK53_10660, partial [Oligoflexia bacterium]|nr:hypothetical protein [Oligoflexia bacterium]
ENKDQASRVIERIPLKVSEFCEQIRPMMERQPITTVNTTTNVLKVSKKILAINRKIAEQVNVNVHKVLCHSSIVNTIANVIAGKIKQNDVVILGNSTPIRAFDQYYFSNNTIGAKIVTHRGVSGIEGFVSTARGYYHAVGGRVILVLGDVSFMHDFAALLYLRKEDNIKIIVINNQRGGLFATLPLKKYDGFLNPMVESPHDVVFSKVCAGLPVNIRYCEDVKSFERILISALEENNKECCLIEAFINHDDDVADHDRIKDA